MPDGDSFRILSFEETCLDLKNPKEEDFEALSFLLGMAFNDSLMLLIFF